MKNKILSLVVVYVLYVLAYLGGYFVGILIKDNLYLSLFIMDVVATGIIWLFSIILKNTSLYDPYWSLTPWVMFTYLLIIFKVHNIYTFILYTVFSLWSWRLTMNWMITFKDLSWEDWRYKGYREKLSRPVYELLNLVGLQMMPTIVVFAGFVPIIVLTKYDGTSALSLIGSAIILVGTLLEFFADHQMHVYLRKTTEHVTCKEGLWKYTRHPNYLGEILIWIGIYVALVSSMPEWWPVFSGALWMILLFEFISIPLMEKRQKKRRPDYEEYIKTTPRLVPFTKFKR